MVDSRELILLLNAPIGLDFLFLAIPGMLNQQKNT